MNFTESNWRECLQALEFTEIKNPNGSECYDILDDKGIPTFQYDNIDTKKELYIFFSGCVYMKAHLLY